MPGFGRALFELEGKMLIHVTPRLFLPHGINAQLIDLSIDEFGLVLKGGIDLVTRHPYPNKQYFVGSRKVGRKAISGLLVETEQPVHSYTTVARWGLLGTEDVVTHRVNYIVRDDEFDAVTDNMLLWYAMGEWSSRWPKWATGLVPASAQPRMDAIAKFGVRNQGNFNDVITPQGLIVERNETFWVPTLERGRVAGQTVGRMYQLPSVAMAFRSAA
jgi:hypothetical protein